jgi:hypothetical protein
MTTGIDSRSVGGFGGLPPRFFVSMLVNVFPKPMTSKLLSSSRLGESHCPVRYFQQ